MKFNAALAATLGFIAISTVVIAAPTSNSGFRFDLVPPTGFSPGTPGCQGDRVGPTGVNVPCRCPPSDKELAEKVKELNGDSFPTGDDRESKIVRFEKTLSSLQALKCPASSTTLLGRLQELTAQRDKGAPAVPPAPAKPPVAPVNPPASSNPPGDSFALDLVPTTGFSAGTPGCQGDRVGPTGVNVPCRCPPSDKELAQKVKELNGKSFPTGNDRESKIVRLEKTLSALQTLKCPASSTTLLGRLKELTAQRG